MKNLKMLYIALIALVAGAFVACTSEFEPGPQVSGPQVAFMDTNATSVDITGDPTEGTQKLVLSRVETKGELTVFVNAEASEGAHLFNIPEEVTFAAGEATAELVYTLDCNNFANDKTYTVNFLILDELGNITTPYGYKEWTVTYAVNPWEILKDSKDNNAKGKFRGVSAIDSFWGVESAEEFDVNIYKHKNLPQYKIEDPWVKVYMIGLEATEEDLQAQFSWTNADLIVDYTDPSNVKIPRQSIGISENYYGYGEAWIEGSGGTLEDGVITFPIEGIDYAHINATNGELIPCNADGLFRIILPGVEVADYSLAVAYEGMDVAADNTTCTAKLKFTYGNDVTGIKYLVVDGHHENNPAESLAKLMAGEDENIAEVEDFEKGAGTVSLKVGLEQGIYTIVAAAKDKSGNLTAKTAFAKSFFFPGLGAPEEHPCEIGAITTKFSNAYPNYASVYPDYSAFAYCIYGTDIIKVLYLVAATSTFDYYLAQGVTLEQLVLANGRNEADLTKVNSENGWVSNAINLDANTEYTLAVYAENQYGESKLITVTHTTDAIPYEGELVIGDYKMSCTAKVQTGEDTFEDMTFESLFKLSPDGENETKFLVTNLGMEDGMKWHATYDATANTLTLDGTLVGMEDKGSVIAKILYGQAGQYYYTIYNYASEESKGGDPIVFGVDPTTKQISSLNTIELEVAAFDATPKYLGFLALYQGATTSIELNTGSNTPSTSSVKAVPTTVKVPFCSVKINKSVVTAKNKLQSIKAAGALDNTNILGIRTVKLSVVERYTPVKVKRLQPIKANAAAIRR